MKYIRVKYVSVLEQTAKENGLTQKQLADKIGVSNATVSKWEYTWLIWMAYCFYRVATEYVFKKM